MRKLLFSAAALMAFGIASAQETAAGYSQGDIFISGNLSFDSSKTGDAKQNNFTVAPIAGYFITNNIAIGGQVSYTSYKTEFGDNTTEGNGLDINAIGRYYFTPANAFSIFGQLQAGYSTANNEDGNGIESTTNGFNAGLGAGLSYFVSGNFALEAGLGLLSYRSTKPDFDGAESTDNFHFGINFSSVNVGITYKF